MAMYQQVANVADHPNEGLDERIHQVVEDALRLTGAIARIISHLSVTLRLPGMAASDMVGFPCGKDGGFIQFATAPGLFVSGRNNTCYDEGGWVALIRVVAGSFPDLSEEDEIIACDLPPEFWNFSREEELDNEESMNKLTDLKLYAGKNFDPSKNRSLFNEEMLRISIREIRRREKELRSVLSGVGGGSAAREQQVDSTVDIGRAWRYRQRRRWRGRQAACAKGYFRNSRGRPRLVVSKGPLTFLPLHTGPIL